MSERFNDFSWMTDKDRGFADDLDASINEYALLDGDLNEVYQQIPTEENAMKIIAGFQRGYDMLDDYHRDNFIVDLVRRFNCEDTTETYRMAILDFIENTVGLDNIPAYSIEDIDAEDCD